MNNCSQHVETFLGGGGGLRARFKVRNIRIFENGPFFGEKQNHCNS